MVAAWGYFLYQGTLDPLGGINSLWPLFGIANQMLAAIALCVGTVIIIKSRTPHYAAVTAIPLAWLVTVTTTAALYKLFDPAPRIGFLAHARDLAAKLSRGSLPSDLALQAPQLILNDRLNAALTLVFLVLAWSVLFDTVRVCSRHLRGRTVSPSSEVPYVRSQLA